MVEPTPPALPAPSKPGWRTRLAALLGRGHSPERIAWSLAAGAVLGLFPIFGTTTLLCLGVGLVFRLNHPALQLANQLMYPVQLPLIVVFVRLGAWLLGIPNLVSLDALMSPAGDPKVLLERVGRVALSAVVGWSLMAPWLTIGLYFAALPLLRRLAARRAVSSGPLEAAGPRTSVPGGGTPGSR